MRSFGYGNYQRNLSVDAVVVGAEHFALLLAGCGLYYLRLYISQTRFLLGFLIASRAGDRQRKRAVLLLRQSPLLLVSQRGNFFRNFRLARRAIAVLFASFLARGFLSHFKRIFVVNVISVSIYKNHIAAILADKVAFAVGAFPCAACFFTRKLLYAFH